MRIAGPNRLAQRIAISASMVILAALLSACGSPSGSLPSIKLQNSSRAPNPPITLAPIIGAPPGISKALSGKVAAAATASQVPVVGAGDKSAEYTLRGYIATSPEASRHKLSYIWDVTDKSGKRVHRITGEEVVPAKPGGNPWSSVDEPTIQRIAASTVDNLANWLPTQTAAVTPVAATRTETPPAAKRPARKSPASTGEVVALVPSVKGAPGDGKKSLTRALQSQFRKKGIKLARNSGGNVYTVSGLVKLGQAKSGKQTISIDWRVTDPKGKKLGTVSQKNTIPQGSLDGAWGPTADAAAAAAAEKIIKMFPKR